MMAAGDIQALQAALAYEHGAIYAYGMIGARAHGQQDLAKACWLVHKARRDRLSEALAALGARPVAAQPAYQLPIPLTSSRSVGQLAATLESGLPAAYVALAGATDMTLRVFAAQAMQEAMGWQIRWGGSGPANAFPGLAGAALNPRKQ